MIDQTTVDKWKKLNNLIYETLINTTCSYTVEVGTDDGFPLVDLLSPGTDIKLGKMECQHIADDLTDDILNSLVSEPVEDGCKHDEPGLSRIKLDMCECKSCVKLRNEIAKRVWGKYAQSYPDSLEIKNVDLGYTHWLDSKPYDPHEVEEPVEDERCEWRYDEHCDMWEGDCGIAWAMIEGTPIENDMMYCPKCGKKLLDTPYDPEDK